MSMAAAITAARVKTYLGIPAGLTMHDTFLDYLCQSATEYVATRLGLTSGLTVFSYSETLDVENDGCDRLRLSAYPIVSITGITDDGDVVLSADYYLHRSKRWVVLKGDSSRFSQGKQMVVVGYTAGWSTIPAPVEHALTLTAAFHFNRAPKMGMDSERIGAYSIALAKGESQPLPMDAEVLLAEHFSPVTMR
jgi:hypothetical protein